jgi:hypothetical protein
MEEENQSGISGQGAFDNENLSMEAAFARTHALSPYCFFFDNMLKKT